MLPMWGGGGIESCHMDDAEYKLSLHNFKQKHKKNGIDSVSAVSKLLKDVIISEQ